MQRASLSSVWPVALLCLLAFAGESGLARHWAGLGLFSQYNVIFDTDPNNSAGAIAHAWATFTFNHPLLNALTGLPLKALSKALAAAGLVANDEAWRQSTLPWLLGAFAAARALFFFLSFRILGLSVWQASAATLIGSLSFAPVVFGAVPDSYALSATLMALILWLALRLASGAARWLARGWWLAGLCAVGITISNVIHVGWFGVCWQHLRGLRLRPAFLRSVASGAVLLVVACGLGYAIAGATGTLTPRPDHDPVSHQAGFFQRHFATPERALENIARFPERLARGVVPTMPLFRPDTLASLSGPIPIMATYNGLPFTPAAALLWLGGLTLCGLGATIAWRRGGQWRVFGMGALASLLSYALLFSAFGTNTFLYSVYWHTPAMVLVAACLASPWSESWPGRIALGAVILGLAAGDWAVLAGMAGELAAYSPPARPLTP